MAVKPKTIPIYDMPDDVFKRVKSKKDEIEKKEVQCGYGRATVLLIQELIKG